MGALSGCDSTPGEDAQASGGPLQRGSYARLAASGVLLALAYAPALACYGMDLWSRRQYRFFPGVILVALLLARRRVGEMDWHAPLTPDTGWRAKALLAAALALFLAGTIWWSPWAGYVSSLVTPVALAWALGGHRLARQFLPSLVMLAILITPPLRLDSDLALWLQRLAAQASSRVLDVVGLPHVLAGVTIEIPGHRLLVEEACSGVVSVFSVAALGLVLGLWRQRGPGHIALVILFAGASVVLGNALRIVTGAVARYRLDVDLLSGWAHETLGLLLLLGYVALVFSLDWTLARFCQRREALETQPGETWQRQLTIDLAWGKVLEHGTQARLQPWLLAFAALVAGAGFFQYRSVWSRYWRAPVSAPAAKAALGPEASFAMPASIAGWRLLNLEPQRLRAMLELRAVRSQGWAYGKEQRVCLIAVSYPYPGVHDLSVCYAGRGWEMGPAAFLSAGGALEGTVIEHDMTKPPITCGRLLYSAFTEAGEWRVPNLSRRFWGRLGVTDQQAIPRGTYQLQLLEAAYRPFRPDEKEDTLELFVAARREVRRQLAAQAPRPSAHAAPAGAPAQP